MSGARGDERVRPPAAGVAKGAEYSLFAAHDQCPLTGQIRGEEVTHGGQLGLVADHSATLAETAAHARRSSRIASEYADRRAGEPAASHPEAARHALCGRYPCRSARSPQTGVGNIDRKNAQRLRRAASRRSILASVWKAIPCHNTSNTPIRPEGDALGIQMVVRRIELR